jgi:glycosyltransferase involved in cell wall biosynthesis
VPLPARRGARYGLPFPAFRWISITSPLPPITLCLTAGGRPDLLERTLRSLLAAEPDFADVIIANDRGDAATTAVARRLCPDATILHHPWQQGQHATIDEMYALVKTPLIFHCEDDWEFAPMPFLGRCFEAFQHFPEATVISVRAWDDLATRATGARIALSTGSAIPTDPVSQSEWASFTFNPTLLRTDLWRSLGGYSRFNGEMAIDAALRANMGHIVFLDPGCCVHIGDGRHIVDPFFRKGNPWRDRFRIAKTHTLQWVERALGGSLTRRSS